MHIEVLVRDIILRLRSFTLISDQIKGSMVEQQSTYTDDIDVAQPEPVTIHGVEEEVEQVQILSNLH